jgi:osmoprotectant transport system permease protein
VFFYRNEWSQVKKQYGNLTFGAYPLARHAEVYDLVRKGRPDNKAVVAVGFGTDRDLNPIADDLVQIEDDRKVFPAYYAGPLVNGLLLRKFPEVEKALARLKGIISSQEMADLVKTHDEGWRCSHLARPFSRLQHHKRT